MFRLRQHRLLIGMLLAGLLLPMVAASVSAQESPPAEEEPGPDADPLPATAEQVAEQTGLSYDEAYAALLRQPRVGEFQSALEEKGPPSFGGLMVEYTPDYQIVLLASENKGEEVRQASRALPFDDLDRYVVVKETPYTEEALDRERDRAREVGLDLLTTTNVRVATGEIVLTTATFEDEQTLRARLDLLDPPIQAREVIIFQGVSQKEDSVGGLGTLLPGGTSPCTTGFTVKRLSDGVEGVATAAHCDNGNRYINHHSGVTLERVAGQDGGSLDVEWHKTPGLDDLKKIKWHEDGSRMYITGRVSRSGMAIGDWVCMYGNASNSFQCGTIVSRTYEPLVGDGQPHNQTFIQITDDVDTMNGDSGGPWFYGQKAYGLHTGTTPYSYQEGQLPYPYFMPQNYMEELGIQVQVT